MSSYQYRISRSLWRSDDRKIVLSPQRDFLYLVSITLPLYWIETQKNILSTHRRTFYDNLSSFWKCLCCPYSRHVWADDTRPQMDCSSTWCSWCPSTIFDPAGQGRGEQRRLETKNEHNMWGVIFMTLFSLILHIFIPDVHKPLILIYCLILLQVFALIKNLNLICFS